ncbi:hypothetical protein GCM10029978_024010 [Actinoallomurus acanthiterrae]
MVLPSEDPLLPQALSAAATITVVTAKADFRRICAPSRGICHCDVANLEAGAFQVKSYGPMGYERVTDPAAGRSCAQVSRGRPAGP